MSESKSANFGQEDFAYCFGMALVVTAAAQVMTMLLGMAALLALATRELSAETAFAMLHNSHVLPALVEGAWLLLAYRAGMLCSALFETMGEMHFSRRLPLLLKLGSIITILRAAICLALGALGPEWMVLVATVSLVPAVLLGGYRVASRS